ncbi:MAG: isoamylase early set domain-containing protein, partial [Calditrichota bacterium]
MLRFTGWLSLIIVSLLILACNQTKIDVHSEIHQQIPLLRLTAGEEFAVPLQDLFYAEDYKVQLAGEMPQGLTAHQQNDSLFIKPSSHTEGLYLLPFSQNRVEYQIPLNISRLAERTFYLDDIGAEKVTVFGEFNGWNRNATPLQIGKDGKFEVSLKLEPGRYQYKFFADGRELLDPANPDSVPNGFGGFNSLLTIEPRYKQTVELLPIRKSYTSEQVELTFHIQTVDGSGNVIDAALSEYEAIGLLDNRLLPDTAIQSQNNGVRLSLSNALFGKNELHRLQVAVRPVQSGSAPHSYFHQVMIKNGKPLGEHTGIQSHHDQVIYSLMVDRFRDGDVSYNWKASHPGLDE